MGIQVEISWTWCRKLLCYEAHDLWAVGSVEFDPIGGIEVGTSTDKRVGTKASILHTGSFSAMIPANSVYVASCAFSLRMACRAEPIPVYLHLLQVTLPGAFCVLRIPLYRARLPAATVL